MEPPASSALHCTITRAKSFAIERNADRAWVRIQSDLRHLVIPIVLESRLLALAHHTRLAAHPGCRKMYKTIYRNYYWPGLAVAWYATARGCIACVKKRVAQRSHKAKMKLFPAEYPLEDIAMDVFGELVTAPRNNRYLVVIVDRFTQLM